jgi:threonine synthase
VFTVAAVRRLARAGTIGADATVVCLLTATGLKDPATSFARCGEPRAHRGDAGDLLGKAVGSQPPSWPRFVVDFYNENGDRRPIWGPNHRRRSRNGHLGA